MSDRSKKSRAAAKEAAQLALACLLALAACSARGGTTGAAITINFTILSKSNCKFVTAPPTSIDFGVLDLTSTSAISKPTQASFKCGGSAASATYAISADNGQNYNGTTRRMAHPDAIHFLPYGLTLTPSTGTVNKNVEVNLTITPSIAAADFQQAVEGVYTDNITITVAP